MEPHDYERFPGFDADAKLRKWNLWAYIDARDAAQAIRKALEAPLKGAEVFIIANADGVMSRPNAELMAEIFPGVADQGRRWPRTRRFCRLKKHAACSATNRSHSWRKQ